MIFFKFSKNTKSGEYDQIFYIQILMRVKVVYHKIDKIKFYCFE